MGGYFIVIWTHLVNITNTKKQEKNEAYWNAKRAQLVAEDLTKRREEKIKCKICKGTGVTFYLSKINKCSSCNGKGYNKIMINKLELKDLMDVIKRVEDENEKKRFSERT